MLETFLREVVAIVVGKQSEEIAPLLNTSKHVNEFLIAKKLDITINQTRNILYRLSDHGLVSSIRKKDKKKGWYTYFWRIEILKALEFLREEKFKRLNQFRNQVSNREQNQFYVCLRCNVESNEQNALLNDFTCNECGDVFTIKDDSKLIKELKKHSQKMDLEIKAIDVEIDKEKTKLEKAKEKTRKKEEKEKAVKRAAKRKANALARAKEAKKSGKKPKAVKKKSSKKTKKAVKKKTTKKPVKKKLTKKTGKAVKKKPAKKIKKAVKKKSTKKASKSKAKK